MLKNKFAKENLQCFNDDDSTIYDIFIILGEINHSVINSTMTVISDKLSLLNLSKSIIKKAKLISIELLENITKHRSDNKSFDPYFELSISNTSMKITTGNCITKKDSDLLRAKLKEYSTLSGAEIKEKYYEVLRSGKLDDEGNAGLGLLTMINRSQKKYDFKIEEINENESFFNSTIELRKDKE